MDGYVHGKMVDYSMVDISACSCSIYVIRITRKSGDMFRLI